MTRKNYSLEREIEETKRKSRTYKRFATMGVFGTFAAGAVITMSSIGIPLFFPPKQPDNYQTYLNAQTQLTQLESMKNNLASKLEVVYETPKVREAFDCIYESERQQISKLDKAIEIVREDISEIEVEPEITQYLEDRKKQEKRVVPIFISGLAIMFSSFIPALVFGKKFDSYLKKLEKLKADRLYCDW